MQFAMPRLERLAFALGTYEPHVVAAVRDHVRPGMVTYDLGANAGYLTLLLAKTVGDDGRVFAFEPDERSLAALATNIELNDLRRVTLVPKAVSDRTGTTTFATYEYSLVGHIIRPNTADDAHLQEVPTVSLDDFVFVQDHPPPDFLKIDVEGSEELVLVGAQRVLDEIRPALILETRGGWMWQHVEAIMRRHAYSHHFLGMPDALDTEFVGDVLFLPR